MLNLDLLGNGDGHRVNNDSIRRAMHGLTQSRKEFISSCLLEDPLKRRTAADLIKSSVLQEVRGRMGGWGWGWEGQGRANTNCACIVYTK